ncbi:MAG: type II toxin-antitoxin system RelE/ParE family toxin, partial [Microcoleaceae cyanobacterium]
QIYFADEFKRNLRLLSKKYRHIRSDVQAIIEQLQAGELPGKKIPGTDYIVFKVRVKNSDIKKGKSSGYRLIYHVKEATIIFLMTIYAKSDIVNISVDKIQEILNALYEGDDEEIKDESHPK